MGNKEIEKHIDKHDRELEKELRAVFKPIIEAINENSAGRLRLWTAVKKVDKNYQESMKDLNRNIESQDKINKAFLKQIDCLAKHILMLKKSHFAIEERRLSFSPSASPPNEKLNGGKNGK